MNEHVYTLRGILEAKITQGLHGLLFFIFVLLANLQKYNLLSVFDLGTLLNSLISLKIFTICKFRQFYFFISKQKYRLFLA